MDSLLKEPKKRYLALGVMALIVFLVMAGCGIVAYSGIKDIINQNENKQAYTIEGYDYSLRGNATEYQIGLFNQLSEALKAEEKDDKRIAELVAMNYVADFYTWTNKLGPYDIGGMHFVYSSQRLNIYDQAKMYFYHYLNYYQEQYGEENLLEVDGIDFYADTYAGEREIDGVAYPDYIVKLQWTYKATQGFDTDSYTKAQEFHVIKFDDTHYEIAEVYYPE